MKEFKGMCPVAGKEETIYCETLDWTNLGGDSGYYVGRMYDCSANGRYNLCSNCPINPNNHKGGN